MVKPSYSEPTKLALVVLLMSLSLALYLTIWSIFMLQVIFKIRKLLVQNLEGYEMQDNQQARWVQLGIHFPNIEFVTPKWIPYCLGTLNQKI